MAKKIKKVLNVATLGLAAPLLDPEKPASAAPSVAAPDATPTAVGEEATAAREAQRKRQLAAAGLGGNVLTAASGLSGGAYTAGKSLLGS